MVTILSCTRDKLLAKKIVRLPKTRYVRIDEAFVGGVAVNCAPTYVYSFVRS